jgi:hypothetical protein
MNSNLTLKLKGIFKESFNENLFCIHFVQISVPSLKGTSYQYILYIMELHHHHIIDFILLNHPPKTKDIIYLLENVAKSIAVKNLIFVKSSPFYNLKFTQFLENYNLQYYHLIRNEMPEIVSISAAYLTRITQFHIMFNHKVYKAYIEDLILFWGTRIVPVTGYLSEQKLIDGTVHVRTKSSNFYEESDEKIDFYDIYSKTDAFLLMYNKFYNSSKHPVSLLILFDLKSNRLVDLYMVNGSITNNYIFHFLNKLLNNYNKTVHLLIPSEEKFNNEEMKSYFEKNNINTIVMNEEDSNYLNHYKKSNVAAQITNNYFRDYLTKVSSSVDNLEDLTESLKIHWNTSVYTIISDQIDLAIRVYK